MNDHYFTSKPRARHNRKEFTAELRGKTYISQTDAGVFSKDEIDLGSRILIDSLDLKQGDTVLDLGCGYGPIGIAATDLVGPSGRVYLIDVNERACELARENLAKNGIRHAEVLVSDGLGALPHDLQFD